MRISDWSSDVCSSDLLAERLIDILESFGSENKTGSVLIARLSQSELASMVGTSRQTVNRILQTFQNRGWVSISGGVIIIKDSTALKAAAQSGARLRGF